MAGRIEGVVLMVKLVAFIVSVLYGRPDLYAPLIEVCQRESRCTLVGTHQIDAHLSNREWYGQVHWGHLDPACQPRDYPGGWATRGAFGLSAGAHWAYLWPCYTPDALDNPFVSAWVAIRKLEKRCPGQGWCPRSMRGKRRRRSGKQKS